jgi:signal transduction histidine kinase
MCDDAPVAPVRESDRLRLLIETGIAISSELSLDGALERIVEASALVTGARYAALGVIDRTGTGLERFITHGIDAETRAALGDLPRGRGILGVLLRDARTLRLHDMAADPRSVGFPPGHPPMRTFLGAPISLRGVAYGNLYLTEKEGGVDFDQEDEEVASLLGAQAAVAIENARLYESATAWSRQLESLQEIGTALAGELDLPRILQLVVVRLRELIGARLVAIALPDGAGLRVEAIDGAGAGELLGEAIPNDSKVARVFERGRSETVDALLEDSEVRQDVARRFNATTGLYAPLVVGGVVIGIVFAHDKLDPDPRFGSGDLRLAEQFAGRAAVAVDLSRRVARDSLRRLVEGQEMERRRLARELHDETGQALTSVLLLLKAVEDAESQEALRAASANLRELVVATLQDVRRLALELRPKALDDFGLTPALERLSRSFQDTTGITVQLESQLGETRLASDIETTLYRIVQEALTNVAKHAGAKQVSILLVPRGGSVTVVIEDDGRGFSQDAVGGDSSGLIGMRERVALLNGRLEVESSPDAGTTIAARVPLR